MLTNIKVGAHDICLRATDEKGCVKPNIFSLDSLSLLIGLNGSGKTRALKNIVEMFRMDARGGSVMDCTVRTDDPSVNWLGDQWGVIYYTPVPHAPKIPRAKRVINASPKSRKEMTAFDLDAGDALFFALDKKLKLTASLMVDCRKVFSFLIGMLLEKRNRKLGEQLLGEAFLAVLQTASWDGNTFAYNSDNPDFREEGESETDGMLMTSKSSMNQCIRKFQQVFRELRRPEEVFSFFAVLDHELSLKNVNKQAVARVLDERFGISIRVARSTHSIVATLAEQFHRKIDELMNFIDYGGVRVKTGLNSGFEFEISDRSEAYWLGSRYLSKLIRVGWSGMSSGEWALVTQFHQIRTALEKMQKENVRSILLLIDEGDAFLHLEWQRCYIAELDRSLASLKAILGLEALQVIIATHSPLLASDVPAEYVCRLDAGATNIKGFAAPLQELLSLSFSSKPVGQHAINVINKAISGIANRDMNEVDDYVVSIVDDPLVKQELERLMSQYGYAI